MESWFWQGEAMVGGWLGVCVPVILSDEIDLPFQNVLDYSDFFYQVA
jgi:hypothetical protein